MNKDVNGAEKTQAIRQQMVNIMENREFDDDGTESKEPEIKTDEVKEPVTDETEAAGQAAEPEGGEPEKEVKAPEHWSKEDQALFLKLDEGGQNILLGIDKNVQRGITEKTEKLAKQRTRFEGMDKFFETYHQQFPNTDKAQFEQRVMSALPGLMNTYISLGNNPVDTLFELIEAYNVGEKLSDKLNLVDYNDPNRDLERVNKKQAAEIEALKRGNVPDTSASAKLIDDFRVEQSDDGGLKHPKFDAVKGVMGAMLATDPDMTLEAAYESAIWTDPEGRETQLATQKTVWEAEKGKQREEKAAGARKNASQKTTSGKGSPATPVQVKEGEFPQKIGDGLRETYRELSEQDEE